MKKMKKLLTGLMGLLLVVGLNAWAISPIENYTQFTEKEMIKQKWNWDLPVYIVNNKTHDDASVYFNYREAKKGIPKVTLFVPTAKGYKQIPITKWPLTLTAIREAGTKAGIEIDFYTPAMTETVMDVAGTGTSYTFQTWSNGTLMDIYEDKPLDVTKIYQGLHIK